MKEDCKRDFERLSEYLDGELDDALCSEIERHFRECPECRACVDSMRKTIRLCREAAIEVIPAQAKARLRVMLQECLDFNDG